MKDVLKTKEGYSNIGNNVTYVIDGEIITSEEYDEISKFISEENFKKLMWKYENKPDELDLEEIKLLRKSIFKRKKDFVNLKYEKGFYMVSHDVREYLGELSWDTRGILQEVGFMVNSEGTLKYKNNRPVRTFTDLQQELNISDGVWRKVKIEIDKFEIIKREKIDGEWYLALNPMYQSNSYEITYFKFLCFGKLLKDKYLDKIDYLYLCKLFDITPA